MAPSSPTATMVDESSSVPDAGSAGSKSGLLRSTCAHGSGVGGGGSNCADAGAASAPIIRATPATQPAIRAMARARRVGEVCFELDMSASCDGPEPVWSPVCVGSSSVVHLTGFDAVSGGIDRVFAGLTAETRR